MGSVQLRAGGASVLSSAVTWSAVARSATAAQRHFSSRLTACYVARRARRFPEGAARAPAGDVAGGGERRGERARHGDADARRGDSGGVDEVVAHVGAGAERDAE